MNSKVETSDFVWMIRIPKTRLYRIIFYGIFFSALVFIGFQVFPQLLARRPFYICQTQANNVDRGAEFVFIRYSRDCRSNQATEVYLYQIDDT